MNEPLTAYPRDVLYEGASARPTGAYASTTPQSKTRALRSFDLLLHPERPVVLCRYTPPRSFTARNPVEAELVARWRKGSAAS